MNRSPEAILIAGGGIGGLSAAVALAEAGFDVHVLERAAGFSEAGAGIQLGPNATRILQGWGVLERLKARLILPNFIGLRDGRNGEQLTNIPLGLVAEDRYGAPYAVMHRADLQQALLETVQWSTRVRITTGFEVVHVSTTPQGLTVHGSDGATLKTQALIAADGIGSRLREGIEHDARPVFAGKTAWRSLVPSSKAPWHQHDPRVWLWMGPRAHIVQYPVMGGEAVNVVAVVHDAWQGDGWSAKGETEDLLAHFHNWCDPALKLLHAADAWRKWALYDMPALKTWSAKGVVLLGDAAHPILPFMAQGGAMAIEDAAMLAGAIAQAGGPGPEAFARYEEERRPRVERVQAASRRMGGIYEMGTPIRWLRNAGLRMRSPDGLLEGFDWLYAYRTPSFQRDEVA